MTHILRVEYILSAVADNQEWYLFVVSRASVVRQGRKEGSKEGRKEGSQGRWREKEERRVEICDDR